MRALVTGGGGFLGRFLVEQLLARGDTVSIFSRGDYPHLTAQGVTLFRGDLRQPDDLEPAVSRQDAVFHVAALPGIWGSWKTFYEINTLGTEHVIQACRKHSVPRLIYTSSPSVVYDGRPHTQADESLPYPQRYLCHYPRSKALAEQAVLAANGVDGLLTVALRPHLIWGPRDQHLIPRLIARARQGRLVQVGDGSNLVSMSYVENAAVAHLQAHDALSPGSPCAGQAYFINELEPVPLWGWVNELLALGGLPPVRRRIPANLAWGLGACCELVCGALRRTAEPPMTRFLASQLSQSHCYSTEKAQRDFGYRPAVSYEEGMRRLAPLVQALAAS
jgi:nucleoside-diphosphate-sugar epimerase